MAAEALTDGNPVIRRWDRFLNSLQASLKRSKWLKPSRLSVLFLILKDVLHRGRINLWDLSAIDIHPVHVFLCNLSHLTWDFTHKPAAIRLNVPPLPHPEDGLITPGCYLMSLQLMKAMNKSNEHVLAMGVCFNDRADSHLVCVQNDDGNYQTQAISIHHQPRKGADTETLRQLNAQFVV